jgi:hypothetical protein
MSQPSIATRKKERDKPNARKLSQHPKPSRTSGNPQRTQKEEGKAGITLSGKQVSSSSNKVYVNLHPF